MSGRAKLAALRAKVKKSRDRTETVRKEQVAKRASRPKPKPKAESKPVEKKINSVDVEGWFRAGIFELYGNKFIVPPWTVKQRSLAKKLLGIYGPDLTEKAVKLFCEDWDRDWETT